MSTTDPTISTYYAVPVKLRGTPVDTTMEKCCYFDSGWISAEATALRDILDQNMVAIVQVEPQNIPDRVAQFIATSGFEINKSVLLFSAVAKTLGGSGGMPNLFLAREDDVPQGKSWSVVIPVAPTTRRGVILVFQFPEEGAPVQLIATDDPEVESGSSN
ncbi:hypothetical protein SAMN05216359_108113 [Roseateles sp. YR242]|uniref:hypothetical protein n=1 Tax=Roseateles sp. YR242 TaxID=1855305 RepID=UPI0008C1FAA0|nr:hypothetical protein [Roseateles sp. YR242]SEL38380.1 hypothetical protein SAMN05216359_108113 [Roseateles sp. YR242]